MEGTRNPDVRGGGLNQITEFVAPRPNLEDGREYRRLPARGHLFVQQMETTVELVNRVWSQKGERHQGRDDCAVVGGVVEELDDTVLAPRKISDGCVGDTGGETVKRQKIRFNEVGARRINVYAEPPIFR